MDNAPVLVMIRGNSASGKSTVARRVQRALPRGRAALIGLDHVRRELLWERESGPGDTIPLLETMAEHCLRRGRTVLLEGILRAERYAEMHERLIARHDGPSLVYYFDVSLAETLRRHALKPIASTVSADEVASWYVAYDVLGVPGEMVLGEEMAEDAIVERILGDLAALGERPGAAAE